MAVSCPKFDASPLRIANTDIDSKKDSRPPTLGNIAYLWSPTETRMIHFRHQMPTPAMVVSFLPGRIATPDRLCLDLERERLMILPVGANKGSMGAQNNKS
jgi:hypothetical protein